MLERIWVVTKMFLAVTKKIKLLDQWPLSIEQLKFGTLVANLLYCVILFFFLILVDIQE
jgi:hypothetical protein